MELTRSKDGELYLAELPPNVENALAFSRRWNLDNKRELMLAVVENHLRTTIADPIVRSVTTLMFCSAIIPLCGEELNFRALPGTTHAFPDFDKLFGSSTPIPMCGNRHRRQSFTRWRKHDNIPSL